MIDPETEHLMSRAKEEAVLAIQAKNPAAARAHHGLAVRYSTKAVIGLAEDDPSPVKSSGTLSIRQPEARSTFFNAAVRRGG